MNSQPDFDPSRAHSIIEAILLVSAEPVSPGKFLGALKGLNGKQIREAIDGLNKQYDEGNHAMRITEAAGGFQLVTTAEFAPWVRRFQDRGQIRLSQAGRETLAIVAFKQPVTRIEIDSVRGVDSGGVLRTLLEVDMVRIVGRSEGLGRPMLFGTTKEFMVHFGLKSLADLPKPKELEELLAEGERKHAMASAGVGDASEPVSSDGKTVERANGPNTSTDESGAAVEDEDDRFEKLPGRTGEIEEAG